MHKMKPTEIASGKSFSDNFLREASADMNTPGSERKRPLISVIVPCYNDEKSVAEIYERVDAIFRKDLPAYDYELIYVDDCSKDNTWEEIKKICAGKRSVKAIRNARNFGFDRNVFESFRYASGDCAFMMFGDLQDPPEMLPEFVKLWESGYRCVVGQRERSDESAIKYRLRRLYYRIMDALSDSPQLQMVNGFGLYDRAFLKVLEQIQDTKPFFKTVLNEYGMDLCVVPYHQSESRRGRSNFNFLKNYDFVMHGLTSSTKMLMRAATFVGIFVGFLCIIVALYVFIRKILFWDSYPLGSASIMVGVFFLGAIQLFFIGVLGEYILNINEKTDRKPRVVVGRTIHMSQEGGSGRCREMEDDHNDDGDNNDDGDDGDDEGNKDDDIDDTDADNKDDEDHEDKDDKEDEDRNEGRSEDGNED